MANQNSKTLRLALPKGRMQEGVFSLLADAGIQVRSSSRGYRPILSGEGLETKILKPQNIIEMLEQGSRDLGFAGKDWVLELGAHLEELLDTSLDPVRMVVAVPQEVLAKEPWKSLSKRPFVIASEYERLTKAWLKKKKMKAKFIRSYGATEVFPPEDADCIVDITQSGATLKENQLEIVDQILTSSTRLYASPKVLKDKAKREKIDHFVLLLGAVLEARKRVMVEVNVSKENLEKLVKIMPCMREPTISLLHGESGYAIKAAVPREDLPRLIPQIRKQGGTDIVVTKISQIVS